MTLAGTPGRDNPEMGVLDYDPAGMEALASSLIACATSVMAERGGFPTGSDPQFQGPAADLFFVHCRRQRAYVDAAYGDLMAAASLLQREAADVRSRQGAERRRIAQAEALARALAADRARRPGGRP